MLAVLLTAPRRGLCKPCLQRFWDLATGTMLGSGKGHTDYVRCGAAHPSSLDTFVSGSYDHTVSSRRQEADRQMAADDCLPGSPYVCCSCACGTRGRRSRRHA